MAHSERKSLQQLCFNMAFPLIMFEVVINKTAFKVGRPVGIGKWYFSRIKFAVLLHLSQDWLNHKILLLNKFGTIVLVPDSVKFTGFFSTINYNMQFTNESLGASYNSWLRCLYVWSSQVCWLIDVFLCPKEFFDLTCFYLFIYLDLTCLN